ncbi:MAG: hypothetical protein KC593_23355 [Myxococcales bacterium]|nr:hypothetical protein [Myxococcales bacterium]
MISSARFARRSALVAVALVLGLVSFALPSCTDDSAGIQVPVAYRGGGTLADPVETQGDVSVRLLRAHVAVHSLTLEACPASTLARLTAALSMPVARAHSASSPTYLGVPVVLDALGDEVFSPGTFRPTPGTYCGVHGMLAVPDGDALGASTSNPLTGAVELHGERLDAEGQVVSSFTLTSTMSVSFDIDFDEPLVLGPESLYAEVTLSVDPSAWAAAVTLPDGALDAAGASALSRAAADAMRLELLRTSR